MILGIDEAGRGPWAGPLVVGAVVLGGMAIEGLTDSKKLTKKKRETLYDEVIAQAAAYASGWVTARELDEMGMSEALRLATRRAIEQIKVPYSEIIIDGTVNFLKGTRKGEYAKTMAKADLLVPSVSAASIIAKVERDRYMATLDEKHPGYGFSAHAGYGVARHRAAIESLGVTPEHRLSFAPLVKYSVHVRADSEAASARRDSASFASRVSVKLAALKQSSTRREAPSPDSRACAEASESARTQADTIRPTTKAIGNASEDVAANELARRGHTVLERNWRTKFCEIDIVSQKDETIYFVEVKHRKNDKAGDGLVYITPKKLKQMQFAAKLYAHNNRLNGMNLQLVAVATAGDIPEVVSYVEIV